MSKTAFLSRRRFVKTAGVLCATLAGADALSACASESAAPTTGPESAPEPEPQPETSASDEVATTAEAETPEPDSAADTAAQAGTGNVLVAYFSYPETTEASDPGNLNTEEENSGDRPDLAEPIPDLSAYDTVFIGHPIWWAELPPVMHSFLEQADLAGKQVYLFNTHGGSGNAGTKEGIKDILADASVAHDNFVVSRDTVADCEPDVLTWLQGLDF